MIDRFRALLGDAAVWETGRDGSVARELGVTGAIAAAPSDEAACAAVLRLCAEAGLAVVPWGGGQHQRLGGVPTRVDVVLVTTELRGIVAHDVADQTLVARAGTPLKDVLAAARAAGQFLPFDPPGLSAATVGGVVAAGINGPLRTGFGLPRDWLLGTRAVHPDGRASRSGGRLVKNVTGFDLHRLYHGSLGTLCVLTEVNLRLLPAPAADATLAIGFDDPEALDRFLEALRRSGAAVAALTVCDPPSLVDRGAVLPAACDEGTLVVLVRLLGGTAGVRAAQAAVMELVPEDGRRFQVELDARAGDVAFAAARAAAHGPSREGVLLRLGLLPFADGGSVTGGLLEAVVALAARDDLQPGLVADPLAGSVAIALPREPSAGFLDGLAGLVAAAPERQVHVESGPVEWRRRLPASLLPAAGPAVAGRVRAALDPAGVLAPGRLRAEGPS